MVPVGARLAELLAAHKCEQESRFGSLRKDAFIFSRKDDPYVPLYPTAPTQWQSRFIRRHGLPNVSPHDLRHTAATLALESGANLKQVQTLLGHRDPSTTLAFYSGVTEEAQRRTVDGIERLLMSEEKKDEC